MSSNEFKRFCDTIEAGFAAQARQIEQKLSQRLREQHEVLVHTLQARLGGAVSRKKVEKAESEANWQPIDSLSQLRNIVGGRFDNIKRKWEAAGFPLRAHRGDKSGPGTKINQRGWLELSNWILSQGFESRLAEADDEALFQVRSTEK